MNVNKYKCPGYIDITLGEYAERYSLRVYPLSKYQIDEALEHARKTTEFETYNDMSIVNSERKVQLAASFLKLDVEFIKKLTPYDIDAVFMSWIIFQNDITPDFDKLAKHCKWGVVCDCEISNDASLAYSCQSIYDFYGKNVSELTIGQIAYYMALRNAFHEMNVEAGETKTYSKKYLETLKQSD